MWKLIPCHGTPTTSMDSCSSQKGAERAACAHVVPASSPPRTSPPSPVTLSDEDRARAFLLEHYSLGAPLRVCQLVVAANRVSETCFNTPEHYAALEAKRAAKRARL